LPPKAQENPLEYFNLRNFKRETVLHVAAKNNAIESLKAFFGTTILLEELLKRDFIGDTPIHTAAKSSNL
jgi:ankyrin repeat protein